MRLATMENSLRSWRIISPYGPMGNSFGSSRKVSAKDGLFLYIYIRVNKITKVFGAKCTPFYYGTVGMLRIVRIFWDKIVRIFWDIRIPQPHKIVRTFRDTL